MNNIVNLNVYLFVTTQNVAMGNGFWRQLPTPGLLRHQMVIGEETSDLCESAVCLQIRNQAHLEAVAHFHRDTIIEFRLET